MTSQPSDVADVTILAHHSLLLAIPAFVPAILVVSVITWIAMRDRRDGSHSEHTERSDQDESA